MSDLTEKIQEIMKDVKENISNEKDVEFVNKKLTELSIEYLKLIENISNKIDNIEQAQSSIENKINKIQTSLDGIESDIYEDDYDFEIICPYCNTKFEADITSESDIKCPECQNTIELDWNDCEEEDYGCSGSCSSCGSKCGESWLDKYEEDNEEDNYEDTYEDNDEDDE